MKSLVNGLWFGLAGLGCAALLFSTSKGSGWDVMIPASGIAAFLAGTLIWWILIDRNQSRSIPRSMLAGGLAGWLAHPIAWYIAIVINFASGARSSLGEETLDPLAGLWGALVFSFISWLLVGWLTVLVGGLVGTFITIARRSTGVSRARN